MVRLCKEGITAGRAPRRFRIPQVNSFSQALEFFFVIIENKWGVSVGGRKIYLRERSDIRI